eukprot:COSAG02_NODE_34927_length_476_cov_0.952255_1_plen_71_part_10
MVSVITGTLGWYGEVTEPAAAGYISVPIDPILLTGEGGRPVSTPTLLTGGALVPVLLTGGSGCPVFGLPVL